MVNRLLIYNSKEFFRYRQHRALYRIKQQFQYLHAIGLESTECCNLYQSSELSTEMYVLRSSAKSSILISEIPLMNIKNNSGPMLEP